MVGSYKITAKAVINEFFYLPDKPFAGFVEIRHGKLPVI
jgi:hypothetical protein